MKQQIGGREGRKHHRSNTWGSGSDKKHPVLDFSNRSHREVLKKTRCTESENQGLCTGYNNI